MARPKIAILYVGGSIGMVRNQRTGRIEPLESLEEIHRFLPELQRDASLQFFSIANLGSSDVTPDHWVQIAKTIEKHMDAFQGFVVVHGSNTMAFTAAALAFALQGISKPVILTGSIHPINELGSDGRTNLAYAIRAAQLDIAEVCIVMGPEILRGCRAIKTEQSVMQTFSSPGFPVLGEFSNEVTLHPWRMVRRKRALDPHVKFNTSVVSITLHPGMPVSVVEDVLKRKPSGVVLRAYGLGMLPEALVPILERFSDEKIPLVISSQLRRGTVDLRRYSSQSALADIGIISAKDMTFECAIVKLMWVLANVRSPKQVKEWMETSLVGELGSAE